MSAGEELRLEGEGGGRLIMRDDGDGFTVEVADGDHAAVTLTDRQADQAIRWLQQRQRRAFAAPIEQTLGIDRAELDGIVAARDVGYRLFSALPIVISDTVAPGTAEFRNRAGDVVGVITGLRVGDDKAAEIWHATGFLGRPGEAALGVATNDTPRRYLTFRFKDWLRCRELAELRRDLSIAEIEAAGGALIATGRAGEGKE